MKSWKTLVATALAIFAGIFVGLLVTFVAGESPLKIVGILWNSAFGSAYDFGMSLFYATPLIFTGLSVAVAFRAGMFNIGAEGQLAVGALACAWVAHQVSGMGSAAVIIFGLLGAALAGAFWGGIAGWLKAKRGGHEVISTMMLNFVAAGVVSWLTVDYFKDPTSQNPQSPLIAEELRFSPIAFFDGAPVNSSIWFALIAVALFGFLMDRTLPGFRLKAIGQNIEAAKWGGIATERVQIWGLVLAGMFAGLVGFAEVIGSAGRFKLGFSPGYGFVGIAVALLGRGKPTGIVFGAFLFGALHKGTADLDFETENITRELSLVIQAAVILSVSAIEVWSSLVDRVAKQFSSPSQREAT